MGVEKYFRGKKTNKELARKLDKQISEMLGEMPTLQVKDDSSFECLEFIMCKDCAYATKLESGLFRCEFHTVHTITKSSIFNVRSNDFCSYAKRREK